MTDSEYTCICCDQSILAPRWLDELDPEAREYAETFELTVDDTTCDACKARALEPQGEVVRLFTPAPNQMPGQLTL